MNSVAVLFEQIDSERDFISHSLSLRISRVPQFEIRRAVVGAIAVFVMNCLVRFERSTDFFLHHFTMFEFGRVSSVSRVIKNTIPMLIYRSAFELSFKLASCRTIFFAAIKSFASAFVKVASTFNGFVAKQAGECRRRFCCSHFRIYNRLNLSLQ